MGVGHLAVGFAAKRAAPRAPLSLLLLGAVLLDALWSTFVLLGIEHARIVPGITAASPLDLYDYPISHSLLTAVLWASGFALTVYAVLRDRAAAGIAWACVLSHWILDFVSHRPDVPVGLHGPYLGLGLWSSLPATVAVEELMLAAGAFLYLRSTTPRSAGARWGAIALIAVMLVLGAAGYLGSPPPSISAVAVSNVAVLVLLLAAHAIDTRRTPAAVSA